MSSVKKVLAPGLSLILYSWLCSSHENLPHPHMKFFSTWRLQWS